MIESRNEDPNADMLLKISELDKKPHQQENLNSTGQEQETPKQNNLAFSIDKLTTMADSRSADDDIVARLEGFVKKYEQMILDVCAASKVIDRSSQYAEQLLRSALFLQCRRQLQNTHQSMNCIDLKVMVIQQKLNNIRKNLPPVKHSLVETGPFYYKCVYPGGVRYRDYPSSNAKIVSDDAVVTHNQVIEIVERVFIASEHSVYLHNKGVGWLFENKKDIICFVRVSTIS